MKCFLVLLLIIASLKITAQDNNVYYPAPGANTYLNYGPELIPIQDFERYEDLKIPSADSIRRQLEIDKANREFQQATKDFERDIQNILGGNTSPSPVRIHQPASPIIIDPPPGVPEPTSITSAVIISILLILVVLTTLKFSTISSFFTSKKKSPIEMLSAKLMSESDIVFQNISKKNKNQPAMILSLIMLEAYGSTLSSFKSKELYNLNIVAFNLPETFTYSDYLTVVESSVQNAISNYIKIPEGKSYEDRSYQFEP
jgi:hypothetical protein